MIHGLMLLCWACSFSNPYKTFVGSIRNKYYAEINIYLSTILLVPSLESKEERENSRTGTKSILTFSLFNMYNIHTDAHRHTHTQTHTHTHTYKITDLNRAGLNEISWCKKKKELEIFILVGYPPVLLEHLEDIFQTIISILYHYHLNVYKIS